MVGGFIKKMSGFRLSWVIACDGRTHACSFAEYNDEENVVAQSILPKKLVLKDKFTYTELHKHTL